MSRSAVATSSYDRLLTVSDDPYRDLEQGRHGALAQLELTRLGVKAPLPERRRQLADSP